MKYFVVLIILLLIQSCTEDKVRPLVDSSANSSEIPSHESWNSKILFTDDGKLKAILFSDHLTKYNDQNFTLLENIKVDFYNSAQENKSVLTANKGKVDDITKNMYATENVVASNDSGTVLRTEELMWRNLDQKIISDKFVSIKSTDEVIEGYGFESDQHLEHYVIFNVTYSAPISKAKK